MGDLRENWGEGCVKRLLGEGYFSMRTIWIRVIQGGRQTGGQMQASIAY